MSAQFEFVPRREFGRERWDEFVDRSDDAWLWHRFDFQDVICTWPAREDLSFAVVDTAGSRECVAVVPVQSCSKRLVGIVPWAYLESFGAPACATQLAEGRKRKVLDAVAAFMIDLANQRGAVEVAFAISALAPAVRGPSLPRVNPLLLLGCTGALSHTWIVDLRRDEKHVWDGMEGRARTDIRKAERAGVVVRTADQARDLETYYGLHQATCARTGITPHPWRYFAEIWRVYVAERSAQVFVAEHEGAVVAVANFAVYKRGALYWTGAASEQGLSLGANALLQWRGMQWMLRNGVEWYETGEAFPDQKTGKHRQLSDFKKSFGGSLYPYFRGQILVRPRLYALRRFARDLLHSP